MSKEKSQCSHTGERVDLCDLELLHCDMGIDAPLRLRVEGDDKDIQGTRHDGRVTKERITENIQAAVGASF